jgi:hypothetical protein
MERSSSKASQNKKHAAAYVQYIHMDSPYKSVNVALLTFGMIFALLHTAASQVSINCLFQQLGHVPTV